MVRLKMLASLFSLASSTLVSYSGCNSGVHERTLSYTQVVKEMKMTRCIKKPLFLTLLGLSGHLGALAF